MATETTKTAACPACDGVSSVERNDATGRTRRVHCQVCEGAGRLVASNADEMDRLAEYGSKARARFDYCAEELAFWASEEGRSAHAHDVTARNLEHLTMCQASAAKDLDRARGAWRILAN